MPTPDPHSKRAYFLNIAWSWLGFATMMASSFIVMPMLIRKLGTAQYGIWALSVSLVEYFWLIDLGFRPATVKLSAEFRAVNRIGELNQLVNTALAYSLVAGGLVVLVGWPNVGRIARLLHIQDPAFGFLIRVVGVSWAAGLVFNVFAAILEGFQRFDLSNRVTIAATLLRSLLSLIIVLAGYGLREMGIALLISQSTGYALMYLFFRHLHPELDLSPRHVSRKMAHEIFSYARQMVSGLVGSRMAQGGLPGLIAYFKPVRFVTYFTQTQRLMEYIADAISRVALVTAPRVSDWWARNHRDEVLDLARFANRYCLLLWGLPASYLFVYGRLLCRTWINEEFADAVGVILPVFLIGYTFWMGQFISSAVLMGIGRYTAFSVTLFVESILVLAGAALTLPVWGLTGAAIVYSACMVVSRCVILSYLFTRQFEISQVRFLWQVYWRPLLLMTATAGFLYVCRVALIPGRNWTELIAAGLAAGAVYGVGAWWLVVERDHRELVLAKARQFLKARRTPAMETPNS
jgi:O-antigen/teichoic acid export membrane protein